ncbi:MAG: L-sorbosone dehydrogenase [Planctomycetota bacterium]
MLFSFRGVGLRLLSPARPLVLLVACPIFLLALSGNSARADLGVVPADQVSTIDGFEVDLVYEVPSETQGSWVSLTVDPKNRLLACDQYGGLFRIDVSKETAQVEKLDLQFEGKPFQGAQGLLCAFGSLYAGVNSRDTPSGIYRIRDTDGDDQYDTVERLIELNGGSEHGPHAMILTPDKKRILFVAGNNTNLPEDIDRSRVPRVWREDHLLGRMPDARGHNANRMAPGGFILSLDPTGEDVELVATGFRNPYDIALNRSGDLFTYDADMEWDVGTPWYRPTRVNHVISGAEFGWRNGTGKWPEYYPDSFGTAVDIGPGSPTGICFGYGAKFPAKYQNALFICDWSYGNIHAVHLDPTGASYGGSYETLLTAAPLPVTDIVVHPDGAMYFTVGGRKTQSGLYRVRYTGDESVAELPAPEVSELTQLRRELEALHVPRELTPKQLEKAIVALAHDDRSIRFAARIAIENQGSQCAASVLRDARLADAKIQASLALARTGDAKDRGLLLRKLGSIQWDSLDARQRVDLLRAYGLVAIRCGGIPAGKGKINRETLTQRFTQAFPSGDPAVDRELAQWLVYLGDETAPVRIVAQLRASPSQEDQIHFAMTLRKAKTGWTDAARRDYFKWFQDIATARGGMSFGGFLDNIKKVALKPLDDATKQQLADVLAAPKIVEDTSLESRPLIQDWTVASLETAIGKVDGEPDFERGKKVFAGAACYKCHRMGLRGGILGPDLTSAGGKYGEHDLLVSIIEPSKEISDQYGATQFMTDDGEIVSGRVVNMNGDSIRVMTNMLEPSKLKGLKRDAIEDTRPSKSSMMPDGLLDTYTAAEVRDLIAYLRAGGNENHPIYRKPIAKR